MAEWFGVRLQLIGRDPAGRFSAMETHILAQTQAALTKETTALYNQVRTNISTRFKNPSLMQSAVGMRVRQAGPGFIGEVDASGEITGRRLPFMRIQEVGGTVKLPAIFPKNRQALWFTGARHPFASARPHNVKIPARSYLVLALQQRQAAIAEAFRQATVRGIEES